MLRDALTKSIAKLGKLKEKKLISDFVLIGGHAVSALGYPRATDDIDFAISTEPTKLQEIATRMGGTLRVGDIRDKIKGTIKFEINSIPIELILLPPALTRIAMTDREIIDLNGISLPIPNWRSIVILKLYAGGPRDLEDAKRVIDVQEPGQRALVLLRENAAKLRLSRNFDRAMAIDKNRQH